MKKSIFRIIILFIAVEPFVMINPGRCANWRTDDKKSMALTVLQNKCNVCHRIRNPKKVFNWDNMEVLAPKIYKQVFVKERMPKGNAIKLNDKDRQILMDWLKTQPSISNE